MRPVRILWKSKQNNSLYKGLCNSEFKTTTVTKCNKYSLYSYGTYMKWNSCLSVSIIINDITDKKLENSETVIKI